MVAQSSKPIVKSKMVWVNAIMTIIAVISLMQTSNLVSDEVLRWLAFAVGVLNIILRIWFTDTKLEGVT